MDINAYLNRINYTGSREPSLETLAALQLAHLYTVPFENLSIHNNQPIILDEALLFKKVINRNRGGFCYELNGLFSSLLREMGFQVDRLSAGVGREVGRGDAQFSPDFDHMTILVTFNNEGERWLADVGFGDTFREPLRLDSTEVVTQANGMYRIQPDGDRYIMYEKKPGKDWGPGLRFGLGSYAYADFEGRCHFQQTSPDSTFVQRGPLCTIAMPTGRKTLSKLNFITTDLKGKRHERELADQVEFDAVLKNEFGVVI